MKTNIEAMDVRTTHVRDGWVVTIGLRVERLQSGAQAAWIAGQITGAILGTGFIPPPEITTNFEGGN